MKRLLFIMLFIVLVAQTCLAITPSIDNRKTYKNAYQWTGKPKDKLLKWAVAMEDAIDGTTGVAFLFLIPGTEPDDTKGFMYYDLAANTVKVRTSAGFVALATASGNSLDLAYDAGNAITVDDSAVTLTTGASDNNITLVIAQNETSNNNDAVTIANAGTGDAIQISPGATTGGGINVIAKASGTAALITLNGATNNWDGANNVGQLTLTQDDAFANTGATQLMVLNSGTTIASAEGFLARFVQEGGAAVSDAYAVEIETVATTPCLMLNGQMTITGQGATDGVLLDITSADTDDDTVQLTGVGSADVLQITPDAATAVALHIVGKANSSVTVVNIDGSTADWIGGADDVAMVEITGGSTANADPGGGLLAVISATTPAASSEGFLARFIHTGTATLTAHAVEIETTNTQPALMLNNQLTVTGADQAGTLVAITGNDSTGNTDTMTINHDGTAAGLKIIADGTTSQNLELAPKEQQTQWMALVDGATDANWIGADDVGMLTFNNDTELAHIGASQIVVLNSAQPKTSSEGFMLRLVDSGTARTTAYAMEIETTATTPCLKLNNQLTITGASTSAGVLLDITSTDTAVDTVQLTGAGSADVLQITSNATGSIGLNVIAKASGTTSDVIVDGTAGWIGAANVGLVHIKSDSALTDNAATLLMVRNDTGQIKDGATGHLARFVDAAAARTGSFGVEINMQNTAPALLVNNQIKIDGADSTGILLLIDGEDTTLDSDSIVQTHDGDGAAYKMTLEAPASVGLSIIGDAAGTHPAINIDLETGAAWVGAATTGALEITNDGLLVEDASLLRLENKGQIAVANDGACLEVIDSGAQRATSYAVRIASASNEALHVDAGLVVIDEGLTIGTTLGVTGASTLSGTVTGDGGDAMVGFLHSVEVEAGTSEQLLIADSGKIFVNSNAGATTFTLPDAAAGLIYYFVDNNSTGAADVIIDCQIGDNIDHDSNGDAIESVTDAFPQSIILIALNGTDWATIGTNGTWGQQ